GTAVSDSLYFPTPIIHTLSPRQAPIGYVIAIFGNNFTRTSDVDFNGATATFQVLNDSLVQSRVPNGATNGPITLAAPGGSVTSDSTFRIGPTMISNGKINLSWNDCGSAGVQNLSFACDTNVGLPLTMIASFLPPPNMNE